MIDKTSDVSNSDANQQTQKNQKYTKNPVRSDVVQYFTYQMEQSDDYHQDDYTESNGNELSREQAFQAHLKNQDKNKQNDANSENDKKEPLDGSSKNKKDASLKNEEISKDSINSNNGSINSNKDEIVNDEKSKTWMDNVNKVVKGGSEKLLDGAKKIFSELGHLAGKEEQEKSQDGQTEKRLKSGDDGKTNYQITSNSNGENAAPGEAILENMKSHDISKSEKLELINKVTEKVQAAIASQNESKSVSVDIDRGYFKGVSIEVKVVKNQVWVSFSYNHSSQAEALQQMAPELMERLQKVSGEQQVRLSMSNDGSNEQMFGSGDQDKNQDGHDPSKQKERAIDQWIEEQDA